jgi:hypothetical protein
MTTPKSLGILVLAGMAICMPTEARAQQQANNLSDLLTNVFNRGADNLLTFLNDPTLFALDKNQAASDAAGALESALINEIGGFPIGSSSGGFTYFFDPSTGVAERSSPSFGPAFAERPLTSGRGQFNMGFTYLRRTFNEIEGVGLGSGQVIFGTVLYPPFAPTYNTDVMQTKYTIKATNDTFTLFANYGMMDRLDLSLAIPMQRVTLEGRVDNSLLRFPGITSTASSIGEASGIGDVAVRAKANILSSSIASVAAGVDLRLPTGDEQNLLGTGNVRTKIYAAMGARAGQIFPHVNIGYTFKSEPEGASYVFGSEFSYTAGAEVAINPRVTIVGDLMGRSLSDEGRLKKEKETVQVLTFPASFIPGTTTFRTQPQEFEEFKLEEGARLTTMMATLGAKFSPFSTFVVSAHLMFPMSKAGLTAKVTPVIGADYTF